MPNVNDSLYQDILEAYRRMSARAMELERELHNVKKDLIAARELLANVFDRYACAACSHGKTGPDCPCGFHAAGAYLDRMENP